MFRTGFMIGRFQPIHNGHYKIIETLASLCDEVFVLIGSAQEFGTSRNPLPVQIRETMLNIVSREICQKFNCSIKIIPIEDIRVGDMIEWGNYVLNVVKDYTKSSDGDILYITGELSSERDSWFCESDINIKKLSQLNISSSQIRDFIRNKDIRILGRFETFKTDIPECLLKYEDLLIEVFNIIKET